MNIIRRHLASPAMLVACAALIIALGGVSYAAAVLPAGSVNTKQLRKGAVTTSKLRAAAVTPSKVDPKTIGLFKGQKGDLGPRGDAGEAGPAGQDGAKGVSGYEVVAKSSVFDSTSSKSVDALCPAGKVPIGGGFTTSLPVAAESAAESFLIGHQWHVAVNNVGPAKDWKLHGFVVCALANQ